MVLKSDMPHILAVDDDDRIRRLLAQYLTKNGYIVVTADNAETARMILKQYDFDLCVLDIMMPGEDGLSLAPFIHKSYDIPILLLTAKTEPNDRIAGLETGADDYLAKPFEPKELLLRIQAILKRTRKHIAVDPEQVMLNLSGKTYDVIKKQFFDGHGQLISLTEGESGLLHALAQKANIPIRREMLAAQLDMDVNDRAVDVQITRLRKKIEDDPSAPKIILTLRGKGYMLKTDDT
tara:strand:+ start:531 stop:1238 length:708 start_codon:yes stop_codon:yes gene_type:complete